MEWFFVAYLDNLEELHQEVLKKIKDLPMEALDWIPVAGSNSCNILVAHIAGAEKFWLGDVVAGISSGRDREAEFTVSGKSVDELEMILAQSQEFAKKMLGGLTLADLDTSRVSPRDNRQVTVAWALDHTLKHTALHLGHIELTCQLYQSEYKKQA
ncbi:MAG: DinB family protein [Chloroflexota bacterium]|nr:MAG: DinB family protein [Chloroflexota bacterium]